MSSLRSFFGLLTLALLLGFTSEHLFAAEKAPKPVEKPGKVSEMQAATKQKVLLKKMKFAPTETAIFVGDMHCGTCAKKMAGKLYTVKGVMKVRTNVKEDVAIITPQKNKKLDVNALWKAAKTAGFPAVKLIGPQGTYVPDPKTKLAKRLPGPAPVAAKKKTSKI